MWATLQPSYCRVVHNLQDPSGESYHSITNVQEHDGMLYLSSVEEDAICWCPKQNCNGEVAENGTTFI